MEHHDQPSWIWPRAAYVHIPFCAHHCGYCDFAVAVRQDHLIDLYLEALAAELATLETPQPVPTLFLGGGTPTYLSPRQLERLLGDLARWLPLPPEHEFSIEANPGTLSAEKVRVLADHGVNRISLGAQSFQPHLLRTLERDHVPGDVILAVERIRSRIPDISLDLIFGVPGQTAEEWESDLRRVLAFGPAHVSTYGLTYEKGTRLWKQRQRGEVKPLDEEAELALYLFAIQLLEDTGFEHYEISNFALPGHRCRHNQVYWANEAYFGFGMGAARYTDFRRELNTRDLHTYIKRALSGEPPTFQTEVLEPIERAKETMAIQLRRSEGILRDRFLLQTGFDLDDLAGPALNQHASLGLVHLDQTCARLTRAGKCVADALITSLL
ncbi:MAG TPA: radical SAM family heme chaperone HemW [Gemmataceae bacterium]|nr:radical SAM family heme chaperone HemW [Gemmataceae bacterium]